MPPEVALLNNYLIVGAMLLSVGLVGLLSRRNMIVMFLGVELMLQGVALSLAAWSRFHGNFQGQVLVVVGIAVAASEAAVALAMILVLFRRRGTLDVAIWHALREADQAPQVETPPEEPPPPPGWPHLPPAGVTPKVPPEETDYRPTV